MIIASDITLGINGKCFKLVKGEKIVVLEIDKYGRVKVIIKEQEVWINEVMLERIANKE